MHAVRAYSNSRWPKHTKKLVKKKLPQSKTFALGWDSFSQRITEFTECKYILLFIQTSNSFNFNTLKQHVLKPLHTGQTFSSQHQSLFTNCTCLVTVVI